jgi:tetratricopeptide (TPR) repeat protein
MRTLNVKFLVVLVGLGTAIVVAVVVTHTLQTARITRALLAQAAAAEEQGESRLATLYLSRYLEFRPADVEVRSRLGCLLASKELADSPQGRERAVTVLEQVLGRDPDRRDSRRLLVRLALDAGNLELAGEHLKILCDSSPDDAEAEHLRGRFHEARGQYAEAADWYRRSIGHDPSRVEACGRLADVLRRHAPPAQAEAQAQEADRVMDELIAHNGQDPKAYVARWRYRNSYTDLKKDAAARKKAAEDVVRARELAADDSEVLVAFAEYQQIDGRVADARDLLKGSIEQHPQDMDLYRALAALELQAGERKKAADVLRLAIKKSPPAAQAEFLWALSHLLIDGNEDDRVEAATLVTQMRKSQGASATTDYLQARLLMAEGKPADAARLLERARPILGGAPEVGEQIDLGLGRCYEQLNDPKRQKEAYDRLAGRGMKSLPILLGLASAAASLGDFDAAIARYREASSLPGAPPEVGYEVVRLLIAQNRIRRTANWDAVETALRDIEKNQPKSAEVPLLRAEALAAQNKLDEARKGLESACAADAEYKQPRLRLALAIVLVRRGETDKARSVLDEAGERGGDSPDLREALADFWSGRPRDEAGCPLDRLARDLERWGTPEQSRVLRALAEARVRRGEFPQAEELCVRLAALPGNEKDVNLRLLLCELSEKTGNAQTARAALDDLKRIEGGAGPAWCYGEAMRLVGNARRGEMDGLPEARRLLEQAVSLRPGWTALVLARGEVAELQNRPEEAITQYKEAHKLGERSERLGRRLVELLYRQQRYKEAAEELAQLRREGQDAHQLDMLGAELSLRTHDSVGVARNALQSATAESKDYRDVLWMGQILAANPQQATEAETTLRRALTMEEGVPDTWVALVQFLAVRGKTKEAEEVLGRAEGRLKGDKRPLALAPCYEAVGQLDKAQEQYREALKTHQDDVRVLRIASGYYLRWLQPQAAEPLLRRIVDRKVKATAEDVTWARQGLAVVLAAHGDYSSFLEALALVGLKLEDGQLAEDGQGSENSIERRRARAHVLATRDRRALRGKAIELLEELDRQQGLYAGDRFLLAQLYEVTDAWAKAEEHLRRLSEEMSRQPVYQSRLIQNLLHQGKPGVVRPLLDRLEALEKDRKVPAGTYGSVELRARFLEATGDGQKAVDLLSAHAVREGARPEDVLLPINSLIRQKRYAPALALTERAWQTKCPPEMLAGVHTGLLRAAKANSEAVDRAERLVHGALTAAPRNVGLLLALAGLEDQRGHFAEAEGYYREIIAADPNDARALNNLAWLLALNNRKGAEALPLIQRAIDLYGPRPDLLDTRALVYLALDQADKARSDLTASIADTPTAARYLHLARVCEMTDDADGAASALRKAKALGLKRAQLHPVEVAACTKLLEGVD